MYFAKEYYCEDINFTLEATRKRFPDDIARLEEATRICLPGLTLAEALDGHHAASDFIYHASFMGIGPSQSLSEIAGDVLMGIYAQAQRVGFKEGPEMYFAKEYYCDNFEAETGDWLNDKAVSELVDAAIAKFSLKMSRNELVDAWMAYSQIVYCATFMDTDHETASTFTEKAILGLYLHACEVGFKSSDGDGK